MRFTPQLRALDWLVEKPIAHRGLHDEANGRVENTESSFAAAITNHYSIECDVQLTSDQRAVVFHDNGVGRVLDGNGQVKNLSASEIKAMNFRQGGDRVQTLEELLEQVNGKVTLIIEIKSLWNDELALTDYVCSTLKSYDGPVAVMSFDENLVAHAAQIAPNLVRGITADRVTDPYYDILPVERRVAMQNLSHLPRSKPHFVSFNFLDLPFTPVSMIRNAGFPVISWTIENAEDAAAARRYSDQVTFEGFMP